MYAEAETRQGHVTYVWVVAVGGRAVAEMSQRYMPMHRRVCCCGRLCASDSKKGQVHARPDQRNRHKVQRGRWGARMQTGKRCARRDRTPGLQDSRTDAQTRTDGLDGSQQQLELGRGLGLAGWPLI